MSYDLTNSTVARQNVLNNPYALEQLEKHFGFESIRYQGELMFSRTQIASMLEIDIRTIERYIASHEVELTQNGYRVFKGKALKDLKSSDVSDMNVGDIIDSKAPVISLFSFRALSDSAVKPRRSGRGYQTRW